jgi:hypothetical protein
MRPPLLLLLIAAGVGLGLWAWHQVTAETPEQYLARRNLEIVEALDAARQAHRERPPDPNFPLLDARQFAPLMADLEAIDLSDAEPDVRSLHERFVDFVRRVPTLFEMLQAGPREETRKNLTLQRMAAEEWSLEVRNVAIGLEVDLREIQEEIQKLREHYSRKPRS